MVEVLEAEMTLAENIDKSFDILGIYVTLCIARVCNPKRRTPDRPAIQLKSGTITGIVL